MSEDTLITRKKKKEEAKECVDSSARSFRLYVIPQNERKRNILKRFLFLK